MSGRRSGAQNRIRGPQSALTDFLASNNISAAQIRADYEARQRAQPEPDHGAPDAAGDEDGSRNADDDEDNGDAQMTVETAAQKRKRNREHLAKLEKIKKSKSFARRKKALAGEPGDGDDDELALDMYETSRPLPGQFSNCDICSRRFTVTPYSKEGPDGGLLCPKCSREAKDQADQTKKQKKAPAKRANRRQNMSDLLDGKLRSGSKALTDLCLEKVADVSNDIDDFGALPENLLNRLSMIFSKKRVMNPRTSHLFLRPDREKIVIYDAALLETSDFAQIFAIVPRLKHLKLTNAGQMKDETIDYLVDRNIQLETLQLEAANLINDDRWQILFSSCGQHLRSLKVAGMDSSFDDETVQVMVKHCPNLRRLKLRDCWKLGENSVKAVSKLKHLEHLSLTYLNPVSEDCVAELVSSVGAGLQTFSLERFDMVGNRVLELVHDQCIQLKKFRFTHNDYATDAAFVDLFTLWGNPALLHVDLNTCRDIDNQNPDGPDQPTGLASEGFKALMDHSGKKLESLRIASCRHISRATLLSVFDGKQEFTCLKELDLSLIPEVDDFVLQGIFKSCPKLRKVIVFACFGVRDVKIPPGVALIGTPKAQDTVVQGDVVMT